MLKGATRALTLTPCSQGQPSPTTWSYTSSGTTAGDLECGTDPRNSNATQLVWTNYKNQMLGTLTGSDRSDVATLYQWWAKNG